MKVVHIDSSFKGNDGTSSNLAKALVNTLIAGKEAQVHYRDLSHEPIGHLTEEVFQGFQLAESERNEIQEAALQQSNGYIDELKDADALVIAVPMYNFNTPSQFKAWIDHVARAGVSFRFGENGPEGLLNIRKAYIVATRGGMYADTDYDFQAPWIKQVLNFIGVQDIEFIYVEGQATQDAADLKELAERKILALA